MVKRSFWVTCPRKLEYFPTSACLVGKAGVDARAKGEPPCAWFINSEEDKYCYWKWIRRVSDNQGTFQPLLQKEITALLKMPSAKINESFERGLTELQEHEEFQRLKDLYLD